MFAADVFMFIAVFWIRNGCKLFLNYTIDAIAFAVLDSVIYLTGVITYGGGAFLSIW